MSESGRVGLRHAAAGGKADDDKVVEEWIAAFESWTRSEVGGNPWLLAVRSASCRGAPIATERLVHPGTHYS